MPAPVLSLCSLVECAQVSSGTATRYARRDNPSSRAWHCWRSPLAACGLGARRALRLAPRAALPSSSSSTSHEAGAFGRARVHAAVAHTPPENLKLWLAFPCGAGQRGVAAVESEIAGVVSEIAEQVELMRLEQAHLQATREAGDTVLQKALLKRDAQLRTNLKQLRTKEERLRMEALRLRRQGALLEPCRVGLSFPERSATHAPRQPLVRPARCRCRRQPCQRSGLNTSSGKDLCRMPASARRFSHQLPSQQYWFTQRLGASQIMWRSH